MLAANLFGFDDEERERMREFAHFVDYAARLDLTRADRHLRLQTCLIDLQHLDFLGRMESFNEDFAAVLARIGVESPKTFAARNQSQNRFHYTDFYTPDLVEQVGEMYAPDVAAFEYQYDA